MENKICPFIGLLDDRDTALEFPAPAHTCYKAKPPHPVKLAHQKEYCLSPNHRACPVFLAAQAVKLPPAIAAPGLPRRFSIPIRALTIGLLAVLLAAFGVYAASRPLRGVQPSIPITGGGTAISGTRDIGTSPVEGLWNQTSQPVDIGARPSCPQPEGWKTYTVLPTDSLNWLSAMFATSIADLLAANCLDGSEMLRPGDVIYVPIIYTSTPPPTITPTVRVVVRAPAVIPPTATPQPPAEAPAPTEAPPPTAAPSSTNTSLPTATDTTQPSATVAPTRMPSLTVAPPTSPAPIIIDGTRRRATINCDGADVTVSGSNNDLNLTGTCASLTVTGNNNDITLQNPTDVTDTGNRNRIH